MLLLLLQLLKLLVVLLLLSITPLQLICLTTPLLVATSNNLENGVQHTTAVDIFM